MSARPSVALTLLFVAAGCGAARDEHPWTTAARGVHVLQVVADGEPEDSFTVVNTSDTAIELSDYVFVDRAGDLDRARHFMEQRLQPGERHVQPVSKARNGFALGSDEHVWIYRVAAGG